MDSEHAVTAPGQAKQGLSATDTATVSSDHVTKAGSGKKLQPY